MINRYLKIQIELSSVAALLHLLPNHVEVDLLSRAFENLKMFDQVTVMLQRSDMTFLEAQEIFNLFLKDFPDFEGHLADDARIVENKVFEKAVLRVSKGLPLTNEQRHAASILLKSDTTDEDMGALSEEDAGGDNDDYDDDNCQSYSQALQIRLKRQRKHDLGERGEQYVNLDMIPATSVNLERLFSTAKYILSDTRKRTGPVLFEALVLLKVNRDLWNMFSVAEATIGLNTSDAGGTDNGDDGDDSVGLKIDLAY
jgi:hypothetical protein